ncbi:H-2 class I histocompatibility antigen, Q9 alpha chain-like isoform X2 [Hemicordylus capensis]|uniref:H-2 class I histocompatibility antigen, Q9 alpha chain-like isoform X2 n=1 Tax=Hemicordylus capensis TaxID=884348 RepID=UPI0023046351|nr:H-2 class I histocompatibility antigen, Q9 alpha chain-like isoform X2 [Hemicordylus capensis]
MGFPRGPLWLLGAAALLAGSCLGTSSHSQRNFFMAVSEPSQGLPQLIAVGYVDDQLFIQYDSDTRRAMPRVPWIEKVVEFDPGYWDRQMQIAQGMEQVFRDNLKIAMNRYNQSGGLHTWQWMYGCEVGEDGPRGGYLQYGYDGRDFLSLDKETLTWTAADLGAQVTKRKWEAEPAIAQGQKAYLEEICIEWLRKYLDYGKETLLRREPPAVKVTRKAGSDGMETHICQAHGFYPKEIDIDWMKDGEVWTEDTLRESVSPNSDGTYHTWLSIKMDPKDRDRYRCRIRHDSLEKPGDFVWEDSASLPVGVIVGAILAVAAAVLLVTGIVLYIKKRQKRDYKAAPASDKGSNSSATA